jgi:hypothetical protein
VDQTLKNRLFQEFTGSVLSWTLSYKPRCRISSPPASRSVSRSHRRAGGTPAAEMNPIRLRFLPFVFSFVLLLLLAQVLWSRANLGFWLDLNISPPFGRFPDAIVLPFSRCRFRPRRRPSPPRRGHNRARSAVPPLPRCSRSLTSSLGASFGRNRSCGQSSTTWRAQPRGTPATRRCSTSQELVGFLCWLINFV